MTSVEVILFLSREEDTGFRCFIRASSLIFKKWKNFVIIKKRIYIR